MESLNKFTILYLCCFIFTCAGYASSAPETATLPKWTFDESMIFPADKSLNRPEDGVSLPGGRLIVTDQVCGLRLVEADGSHRPFGKMIEAGYLHNPPEVEGCANGVTINPDRTHLIIADVFRGGIYRVEIATEATEKIYQHSYGVNMAREDSLGGIWFSQSTRNLPEQGASGLWDSVWVGRPDGALCHIPPANADEAREAVVLADDFVFANGLVINEALGILYISESLGGRVWQFDVDLEAGTVSNRMVAVNVSVPDNLELDDAGRLWIACPLRTEIAVFDPATGVTQSVFRISTPQSERLITEITARLAAGTSWADLAVPELASPAPGLISGLILSEDGKAVYATGLGNAIIKLER